MGLMTQAQLRPLTESERRAVELMDSGADIDDVAVETRLGRAQIVAARDLAALWTAVKRGAARSEAPVPVVDRVRVDTRPVITIEVEPAQEPETQPAAAVESDYGGSEESAPAPMPAGDVLGLLERGRASGDLRIRDLALAIDRQLEQLAQSLDADERTRAVREEIARLEEALAAKRHELGALLPAPASGRAKARFGEPFPSAPRVVKVGGVEVDRRLYYSEAVRSWARAGGHQVAASGKMPRAVVEAYVVAHPAA